MVEFSDAATNPDARGSRGLTAQNTYQEFKYRYRDYYDIMFQTTGNVTHPDAALDVTKSVNNSGWFQYGSFKRYIADNSLGACEIVPMEVNSQTGQYGILNTLDYDGGSDIRNAKVIWLPIDMAKPTIGVDDHRTIGDKTFEAIGGILPTGWDWADVDALLIVYAGNIIKGAWTETFDVDGEDVAVSICSERRTDCFAAPAVYFHELIHSAFGGIDMYYDHAGHYTLMGSSTLAGYTPPMLDPWHRLKFGWISPQVYNTAGEWSNIELHPVHQLDNGNPPSVLVIPVTGANPADAGWEYNNKSYLIVENRRTVAWDAALKVNDNINSVGYGQVSQDFEGGFLIWGAGTIKNGKFRPYEADGNFVLNYGTDKCGDPGDFFIGPQGNDRFGVWTSPGLIDRDRSGDPACVSELTRNVFLTFPECEAGQDRNTIGRLVLDHFIANEHEYGGSKLTDKSPSKYNNQQRLAFLGTDLYAGIVSGDLAYVLKSTDQGTSWRDVYLMTAMTGMGNGRIFEAADNISVATAGNTVWAVWEKYYDTLSYIARRQVSTSPCSYVSDPVKHSTINPLRMTMASLDNQIMYVTSRFNSATLSDELVAWRSTDAGTNWTAPFAIPVHDRNCGVASLTLRKEYDQQGLPIYIYDIVYDDMSNQLRRYSSQSGWWAVTIPNRYLSDPHHAIGQAWGTINIVAAARTSSPGLPLFSISFQQYDLWSGTALINPTDVFHTRIDKVQRDPRVVPVGVTVDPRFMITWISGDGEALFTADNVENAQTWYKGRRSSLCASSLTSYPLAATLDNGEALLGTTRVSTSIFGWPRDLWKLTMKTRAQDIADAAVEYELETGKTVVVEATNARQEFRHREPTVHDGVGAKIGSVRYSYVSPIRYWGAPGGTPFDTLTTTEEFTLTGPENVRFALQVVTDSLQDTTVVESYLRDVLTNTVLVRGGEYRIPPGKADTTLIMGLELPSGVPQATVTLHTTAWRGPFVDGGYGMTLFRDHYFQEPATPKDNAGLRLPLDVDNSKLSFYPSSSNSGATLTLTLPFEGRQSVCIHSVLGVELQRQELSGTKGGHRALRLPALMPGVYFLRVTSPEGGRTGQFTVK